jgi:hypothetical protein
MRDPLQWYDDNADDPPWIKALAEVLRLAPRWHGNCVCQSQRLGSGTSRTLIGESARSIAFSASTTASDLLCDWPVMTTFATDADHFHKFRRKP